MEDIKDLKAKQNKTQYTKKQVEAIRRGALKVVLRREKKEQEQRRAEMERFYGTNSYT